MHSGWTWCGPMALTPGVNFVRLLLLNVMSNSTDIMHWFCPTALTECGTFVQWQLHRLPPLPTALTQREVVQWCWHFSSAFPTYSFLVCCHPVALTLCANSLPSSSYMRLVSSIGTDKLPRYFCRTWFSLALTLLASFAHSVTPTVMSSSGVDIAC